MKYFDASRASTAIGLAYSPGVPAFIAANPGVVDYVEIPFELLRHSPHVACVQDDIPVILHCASMSIAGFVSPDEHTLDSIALQADRTRTPWIGEHLAFMTAEALDEDSDFDAAPTALTYTVCPQLSEATVDRVVRNFRVLQSRFRTLLVLENSPQYFSVPGSTMPMVDFINSVLAETDARLLLDLSHFLITAINTGSDATMEVQRLPLERVVEIHMSGLSIQSGLAWDDHAAPIPDAVFDLLETVLPRVHPRALTLEYNWLPAFPESILRANIERVTGMLGRR